ncbi:hypothetical protein FQN54_003690 [Arachnomyces sp. PD_36]|nr:hypothetical protein FQN54_003690 [Arachnomyces sp. PD_36]
MQPTFTNRVLTCLITKYSGESIATASTRVALLEATRQCITAHRSLFEKGGILHCDISTGNLLVNEDPHAEYFGCLVDLDHATKLKPDGSSGVKGRGTRPFEAIGVLLGEENSVMNDLESFFWVLFWICICYDGPSEERTVLRYEKWRYLTNKDLAAEKAEEVRNEGCFLQSAMKNFTTTYQPLIPWLNKLRKAVFPNGERRCTLDMGLYDEMQQILREAQTDSNIIGH